MRTIRQGARGNNVKYLQAKLHLIQDGIFGKLTTEAVIDFQKANGLVPDGVVGPATWNKLTLVPTVIPKRKINEIIVHCSATPEFENYTVSQIRQMHLQRGFSDIGYHYVIYLDGTVHKGRDINKIGAHCTGHNSYSIGICYIGGCPSRQTPNWANKAKDTRTHAQKKALLDLLFQLSEENNHPKIYGHRNFANKACPSFDAYTEYQNIK